MATWNWVNIGSCNQYIQARDNGWLNSLWSRDTMWRHGTGSTLAHVISTSRHGLMGGLTPCGLETPCGVMELGQHWLM